jgi:hypothetical protein
VTKNPVTGPDGRWSQLFVAEEIPLSGESSITATPTDALGNVGPDRTRTFTIDTSASPAAFNNVTGPDNRVNASEKSLGVQVSGTAEAGSRVVVTWGATAKPVTTDASGAWTTFFTSAEIPSDGATTITAVVTDAAGNVSVQSGRPVVIDTQAPVAPVITGSIAGDNVVNSSERTAGVVVAGTSEANADVTVAWGTTSSKTVRADGTGNWSATFVGADINAVGDALISARQTDVSGNTGPASLPVTVSISTAPAPPTINDVTTDNRVNLAEKTAGVTITGTALAGSSVRVTWGSITKAPVIANADGIWSVNFAAGEVPSDGERPISAFQTDVFGNVSPSSVPRPITVDTIPPEIPVITTPISTDNRINAAEKDNSVIISGTLTDASAVEVRIGVNGTPIRGTINNNDWSVTFSSSEIPADATNVRVEARTFDAVGNPSAWVPAGTLANPTLITIDTVAATPVIFAVTGDDKIDSSERTRDVTVSGSAEANATLAISWNGGTPLTTTANGAGSWSVIFSRAQQPQNPLGGSFTITAQATDVAGNVNAVDGQQIVVTEVRPDAPIIGLNFDSGRSASDGITNDGKVNVTGLQVGGKGYQYSTNGGTTWVAGTGSSFTLSPGFYAANRVLVRQIDNDNVPSDPAVLTSAITVDTTAPSAPRLSALDADGTVSVTGLEANAIYQYSTNGGANWVTFTGSSFELNTGIYAANDVRVRQIDVAGNVSASSNNRTAWSVDDNISNPNTITSISKYVYDATDPDVKVLTATFGNALLSDEKFLVSTNGGTPIDRTADLTTGIRYIRIYSDFVNISLTEVRVIEANTGVNRFAGREHSIGVDGGTPLEQALNNPRALGDGNRGGPHNGLQGAASNVAYNQSGGQSYIEIDLGDIYNVAQVQIWGTNSGIGFGDRDLTFYMSDRPLSGTKGSLATANGVVSATTIGEAFDGSGPTTTVFTPPANNSSPNPKKFFISSSLADVTPGTAIEFQLTDSQGRANTLVSYTATPVVLDLNLNGMLDYSVLTDGAGAMGWVESGDGLLTWDENQNGTVDGEQEYVFTRFGGKTDLEGLRIGFDSNGDDLLDARDAKFGELTVWQDSNQNGVADAGEVYSLSALGITSIGLKSDGNASNPAYLVREAGRTTATLADGSTMLVADVAFESGLKDDAEDSTVAIKPSTDIFVGPASDNLDIGALFLGDNDGYRDVSQWPKIASTPETLLYLPTHLTELGDHDDMVNTNGFNAGSNQTADGMTNNSYSNGSAELWVQDGVVAQLPPALMWAQQVVLAA